MNHCTNDPGGEEVLDVPAVAAELKVSRPTVLRLVWRKQLTPREEINPNLGKQRKYTFTRSEVERFKASRRR
jgi:predicted DNA-binding transcriptional regulator AlpA